jgi:8-oxo-dGTP diphosphatase
MSVAEMTKIGGVILSDDRKAIIVVRKRGKQTYIIPGGRPEGAETDEDALRRELREELCIESSLLGLIGEFHEPAEFDDAMLTMRVYDVEVRGVPEPDNEIVEFQWIGRNYAAQGIKVGSTLSRHVIPALVARGDL